MTVALAVGSPVLGAAVKSPGNCPGNGYVIAADTIVGDSDLSAYDENADGIVCESTNGKYTRYSDYQP